MHVRCAHLRAARGAVHRKKHLVRVRVPRQLLLRVRAATAAAATRLGLAHAQPLGLVDGAVAHEHCSKLRLVARMSVSRSVGALREAFAVHARWPHHMRLRGTCGLARTVDSRGTASPSSRGSSRWRQTRGRGAASPPRRRPVHTAVVSPRRQLSSLACVRHGTCTAPCRPVLRRRSRPPRLRVATQGAARQATLRTPAAGVVARPAASRACGASAAVAVLLALRQPPRVGCRVGAAGLWRLLPLRLLGGAACGLLHGDTQRRTSHTGGVPQVWSLRFPRASVKQPNSARDASHELKEGGARSSGGSLGALPTNR